MAIQVELRSSGGSTVISVAGLADEISLGRLADSLLQVIEAEALVIDVDDLMLNSAHAFRAFFSALSAPHPIGDVALACSRLSGRRVLRRWIGHDHPIFTSADDALAHLESRRLQSASA